MVLIAAGLAASGIGALMQFGAGDARERAVGRAQDRLEQATQASFTARTGRQSALDLMFESLAGQEGTSIQAFLNKRLSTARLLASDNAREGSAAAVAEARGILSKRLAPPSGVPLSRPAAGGDFRESLEAQLAELQPDIDIALEQAGVQAARRGETGFDRSARDILGQQLGLLKQRGAEVNIGAGITEAAAANRFASLQNQLGLNLRQAGEAGGNLRLIGGLLQQGGLLATGIGANRPISGGNGAGASAEISALAMSRAFSPGTGNTRADIFN